MKTQIILAVIIIILFALENVFVYQTGKNSVKAQIIRDTDTVVTYFDVRDTVIIPKFITHYITQTDTIIGTDTIFIDNTQYIARLDTTYEDGLAKLKVDFVSDIPLSKKSYFNLDLQVKKELVFVPTYVQDESFWHNRFVPVLGIGGVYTQDGTADLGLFLGFGIRIN